MLCEEWPLDRVERLLSTKDYYIEQKFDGVRAIHTHNGFLNRNGEPLKATIVRPDDQKPIWPANIHQWAIDGELVAGRFHAFDVMSLVDVYDGELIDPNERYHVRRLCLDMVFRESDDMRLARTVNPHGNRNGFIAAATILGAEGVVLKHKNSPYVEGKSHYWYKVKFTKTIDAIVSELRPDGRESMALALYDKTAGDVIPLKSTCSIFGKEEPKVGNVVEIRYLYAMPGPSLVQPRMLRIRHDKAPQSCGPDQLQYANKTLIV